MDAETKMEFEKMKFRIDALRQMIDHSKANLFTLDMSDLSLAHDRFRKECDRVNLEADARHANPIAASLGVTWKDDSGIVHAERLCNDCYRTIPVTSIKPYPDWVHGTCERCNAATIERTGDALCH